MWGDIMIREVTGNEHIILDGTPRRLREAMILDTACVFFKRKFPVIINIEVSKEWSKERLKGRKRADDIDEAEVEKRLNWFDAEVVPAINWFRSTDGYRVVDINGEQPIEEVYDDMISALFGS